MIRALEKHNLHGKMEEAGGAGSSEEETDKNMKAVQSSKIKRLQINKTFHCSRNRLWLDITKNFLKIRLVMH